MSNDYMLRRWGHFERDRDGLPPAEREQARAFFKALSRMPPDEVKLLAEKYHTGKLSTIDGYGQAQTDIPVADAVLCKQYGLTLSRYGARRRSIINHFRTLYTKSLVNREQTERAALQDYALIVGNNLYFKQQRGYPFFDVTLTVMPEQAAHIHGDNDLTHNDGFTKLSLDELEARIHAR